MVVSLESGAEDSLLEWIGVTALELLTRFETRSGISSAERNGLGVRSDTLEVAVIESSGNGAVQKLRRSILMAIDQAAQKEEQKEDVIKGLCSRVIVPLRLQRVSFVN
jgi:hypothetical protein